MVSSCRVLSQTLTTLVVLLISTFAHAAEPGPTALPMDVLDIQTPDAVDQARALTKALRDSVRAMPGWSLSDTAHSPGALQCAFPVARPKHWSVVPPARDPEKARSLVYSGDDKLAINDVNGALAAYEAGDDIMRVPSTGISVVRALVSLGRFAEAADFARWVANEPVQPSEAIVITDARRESAHLAQAAAKRAAAVKVLLGGSPVGESVSVFVDGALAPTGDDATWRLVNPGKHVLTVAALGYRGSVNVSVREGERANVPMVLSQDAPTPACQARIGDAIKATRWLWGTLERGKTSGTVVARLHFWTREKSVADLSLEYSEKLAAPNDDALRKLAADSITKLTGGRRGGWSRSTPARSQARCSSMARCSARSRTDRGRFRCPRGLTS